MVSPAFFTTARLWFEPAMPAFTLLFVARPAFFATARLWFMAAGPASTLVFTVRAVFLEVFMVVAFRWERVARRPLLSPSHRIGRAIGRAARDRPKTA